MANGLFEERLRRKKKPGEVDIAALQQPKFPTGTTGTPAFREALARPMAPEAGGVVIGPQPVTAAGIRSIGGAPREEQPSALRRALAAPRRGAEQIAQTRAITPQQGPVVPVGQPRLVPRAAEEAVPAPTVTGRVEPGAQAAPTTAAVPQLAETRRPAETTQRPTIDLQSADVRNRLGIGAPLGVERPNIEYYVGPSTKVFERFDPETGRISRQIVGGVKREEKPYPAGSSKAEIQQIKEQRQAELEKERQLWGPRLEAIKAQPSEAATPGRAGGRYMTISGDIAHDIETGRRTDVRTGQPLTGRSVQIGPSGRTETFAFGGQERGGLEKENLQSLTTRYNKALDLAGKAASPDERQQYEQLAANLEGQISDITEPGRATARETLSGRGAPPTAQPPGQFTDTEQQRAPIAAPPWQGLSPTAAMAKRTEVNNRLFQVKDAIESGDESIVRKYFSSPNDNESRYLFSLLSPEERSFIVKRSK